jgi:hypothetical protein
LLEVHRELLLDTARTNAYREAIRHFVTPDSVVLDVGTGSGILSFFACEAGARKVFAVDATPSADLAAFLSRHLGYADRMEVIRGHSTKIEISEQADLLVTETLGPFGFDEHILSSVIDARSRLLRPGSRIIPQRIELFVVPVEAPTVFERHVGFWERRPYGFDLSPIAVFASNVVYVGIIDSSAWLSPPACVITAELATISSADVSGDAHFTVARAALVHGFAGWFRATLAPDLELSNEVSDATSWNHVFLPLERPVKVEVGTVIDVRLESSDGSAWRWRGAVGSSPFDQMTVLGRPPATT